MGSLVGTWRLVSMGSRDEVTADETQVWEDGALGFLTYTEDGRMSAVLAAARRAISTHSGGDAPIEEQAMLFRRSVAYAGRYTVSAGAVIHHVEVAGDPTWIGKDQKRFMRFEGERLILTTPSISTPLAPNPRVFTLAWEKI
jgi:hypothetical protein